MSFLDLGPQPQEYTARALFERFLRIATAVNNLSRLNFPRGVEGTILRPRTTPMGALQWREWPIPLLLPATVFQTTSITPVDVGGLFAWNPASFPGGTWHLEVSAAIANTASIATVTLRGAGDIGTVTTQSVALTRVRSSALAMPVTAQNLWVQLQTSNASHAASLWGARLIFVPQ